MKKQLQKILFLLFLGGCMNAPVNHFESYFKVEKKYQIPFQKIALTSDLKIVDSAHHVENQLPQTPFQIIQNWIGQTLVMQPNTPNELQLILHKAEIIRQNLPAENWWEHDYIQDTLYYQIELFQQSDTGAVNRLNIGGKNFVKMNKKASLAEKEKQWADLYNQMLRHLENEISTKIPHVISISSKN